MEDILVPIFICCVLPLGVVVTVFLAGMYGDKKRAEVLTKALESNNNMDVDKLAEALGKRRKTPREVLNSRLLRGCICLLIGIALIVAPFVTSQYCEDTTFIIFGAIMAAIGISYLIVYFVTRKQVLQEEQDCKKECPEIPE